MKSVRTLGLGILAALALTAVMGVGSASASWVVSSSSTVTGSPTQAVFSSPVTGTFECSGSTFTAPVTGGSVKYVETSALKEVSGGVCHNFGTAKAMQFNGCQLALTPGAETAPGDFSGTMTAGAGCGSWTFETSTNCIVTFSPKSGTPVQFVNSGSGSSASVAVSISSSVASTYGCNGKQAPNEPASYSVAWKLTSATGVRVASTVQEGLYVSGSAPSQPVLAAQEYPATLSGKITKNLQIDVPGAGTAECGGTIGGSLSAASSNPSLAFALSGCKAFGFASPKVVIQPGCGMSLQIANAGPPYTGSLNLACSGGGTGITITPIFLGSPVCTVTIPPQSLGTATIQNLGSGNSQYVTAAVTGTGVQHSAGCGAVSASDSKVWVTFELAALH